MTGIGHLMRYRSVLTLGAAASVVALIAGCGGSSSSSSRASTSSARPTTSAGPSTGSTVTIASFAYAPKAIQVKKGTSITFANRDNASHTATADGGSFDSGTLKQGGSKKIVFAKAGTFAYHCAFHPFMHGTVVVQ